jgi:ubiquinone biosynthesis protein COQ9
MMSENATEIIDFASSVNEAVDRLSSSVRILMKIQKEQEKIILTLKDRIELLEQQVLIISTTIKEDQQ